MKKIKQWWQNKRKAARLNKHAAWVREIGEKSPELLVNFIMEKASEASVILTMQILDREGIAHCKHCVTRFPLRKYDRAWVCDPHFKKLSAIKQKEESTAVAKVA